MQPGDQSRHERVARANGVDHLDHRRRYVDARVSADPDRALTAAGESLEPYAGYLEGFRLGMPPHGGWAIGLERLVARLLGVANVREVTAFPRDLHRIAP